jgi:glutamate transport system permease protein
MTALYDAPGPKARRRSAIASVVVLAVIAAAGYWLVYRPLDRRDQFSGTLWGPLLDPGNEYFSQVWKRIGEGFQATLVAAAWAILASLMIGSAIGILRVQLRSLVRRRFVALPLPFAIGLRGLVVAVMAVTRLCIEVFRGIPVVITVFFVWVALPTFGITFDNARWYLVIGLTIYNSVVIGEILRSGMEGLPCGQGEAASAIGLTPFQTTRLVLLPQAFRIMLPALISQLVVILKDTSLGFIIGYEETLRVGNQIVQVLDNPIQMYTVIGTMFITINYTLSRLARYAERRFSGRSR